MIKHFENLWEEAEEVIWEANQKEEINIIDEIQHQINSFDKLSDDRQEIAMGQVLLYICFLSKKYNINTYAALKNAMNDLKIDMLDPDIELDV